MAERHDPIIVNVRDFGVSNPAPSPKELLRRNTKRTRPIPDSDPIVWDVGGGYRVAFFVEDVIPEGSVVIPHDRFERLREVAIAAYRWRHTDKREWGDKLCIALDGLELDDLDPIP